MDFKKDGASPEENPKSDLAGPLEEYNQKFLQLVESLGAFSQSQEFKNIKGEGSSAGADLLAELADFLVKRLKAELPPEELLKFIELMDKIYLQCSLKGQVNENLMQFLQENGSLFSHKATPQMDSSTKKELESWFKKHQHDLFDS